ncbi:unnamed protein product [Polarella glacialis]|uniref:Uncharacterized protein n=1 Tax=Polarella glacialis TaxID=89957 RepID=A0A813HPB2_POLGL|nr:unnamed protein product [Polarella glacialis]
MFGKQEALDTVTCSSAVCGSVVVPSLSLSLFCCCCFAEVPPSIVADARILELRVSYNDRTEVLSRLTDAQQRCPQYRVVDVGAAMLPWTRDVLDAVVDKFPGDVPDCFPEASYPPQAARLCCAAGPGTTVALESEKASNLTCFDSQFSYARCCRGDEPKRLLRFELDVNSETSWEPVLRHVQAAGKFEYAVASHILEDVANPATILEMLPRIAHRGLIAMPSKYAELRKGLEGDYRGYIHHRWIYSVRAGKLIVMPKLGFLEAFAEFDEVGALLDDDRLDLNFEWEGHIPYTLLNEGFLGPNPTAVIRMYVEAFSKLDDVDRAAQQALFLNPMPPRPPLPCDPDLRTLAPKEPEEEEAMDQGGVPPIKFCSLQSFEALTKDLVSQLGATGERCFRRELQEIRRQCLVAMQAVEGAMTVYHTCVSAQPAPGSDARRFGCQEASELVPRRNASAVLAACLDEDEDSVEARAAWALVINRGDFLKQIATKTHARGVRCARAAALMRPLELLTESFETGLECLASEQMKASFYTDVMNQFRSAPWGSLRQPFRPFYNRFDFLDFAQSIPTWVSWLFELWFLYDNVFLPMFRAQSGWGTRLAPIFRLPPWPSPRGPADMRQVVMERLVEMLAADRRPSAGRSRSAQRRGVALAEVGVFMGETSASLFAKGLPIEVVHLADPWDSANEVFQAVRLEKGLQEVDGLEARAFVERRFSQLAPTYCFDGPAGTEPKPYEPAQELLQRDKPWPAAYRLDGSRNTSADGHVAGPRVAIHATLSVTASRRVAPGSLDLVFIDGAHDFDSALADLRAWWPKLRPGGVMAGHDFSMSFPGVMRAVLDFVSRLPGPRTEVQLDTDYSFWFFKPAGPEQTTAQVSWRPRRDTEGVGSTAAKARVS